MVIEQRQESLDEGHSHGGRDTHLVRRLEMCNLFFILMWLYLNTRSACRRVDPAPVHAPPARISAFPILRALPVPRHTGVLWREACAPVPQPFRICAEMAVCGVPSSWSNILEVVLLWTEAGRGSAIANTIDKLD